MRRLLSIAGLLLVAGSAAALPGPFVDVTVGAGVAYEHRYLEVDYDDARHVAGGVACGDYDGDGWLDLFAVRGDIGPNVLFHNRGDGTFEERASAAGVAGDAGRGAGPTFADVDGDGRLDLLVLGVDGTLPTLFHNRGDGTFEDVTAAAGLDVTLPSFSAAFGDPDRDGDLDLVLTHWSTVQPVPRPELFWRNVGGGTFVEASAEVGLTAWPSPRLGIDLDLTFTPNFADLNGDGWPDLLIASDYATSRVFLNDGAGGFRDVTTPLISDENGMGAAVGDYDNDGILDWFVSSVWDPDGPAGEHWYASGNRLYRGRGDGTFDDVTDAAGVREGFWGWGSTFADFDNDGHLDIFHVNGWYSSSAAAQFLMDPSRLFVANGDGTFTERSAEVGLNDTGMGRGVVAFDYDRDGDLDLFVANGQGPSRLWRNDSPPGNHWLGVRLRGRAPNTEAIGARIWARTEGTTQLRELRAGSNFESQDPAEAHFGIGTAAQVDELRVRWPDGTIGISTDVAADRLLTLEEPGDGCGTPSACVPGGRSRTSECIVETRLRGVAVGKGRAQPSACIDGDPACDADGAAGDGCLVSIGLCTGYGDPRFPRCAPRAAATLGVEMSGTPAAGGLARALTAAYGAAVATGSYARCIDAPVVAVPLRRRRNGKAATGKLVVAVSATAADDVKDDDRVVLRCAPARH